MKKVNIVMALLLMGTQPQTYGIDWDDVGKSAAGLAITVTGLYLAVRCGELLEYYFPPSVWEVCGICSHRFRNGDTYVEFWDLRVDCRHRFHEYCFNRHSSDAIPCQYCQKECTKKAAQTSNLNT